MPARAEETPLTTTAGSWPFFLEKWYVDTLLDDGSIVIVLLGRLRVLGLERARLTAELHRPDGTTVRGSAAVGTIRRGAAGRTFDGGRLEPTELTWRTPTLSGRLRLTPRYPATQLGDPLVRDGSRQLRWIVEVPDAEVDGELAWDGQRLAVKGRGYRDYLALDLLPWRVPLRELHWGRAACGAHACCWVRQRLEKRVLEGTWRDGAMTSGYEPPALERERVIQRGPVADLPLMRIGPLRSVLRRLARDPQQTRTVSRATLDGERGWAVHEAVQWR
ncbi:MAG: hypothetical protein JSW43_09650 [Gemmatimonadota bacterium]|nr:MAG: hypothetical protein JSW43_09650 [Gemmatimonadota bacterium]